MKNTRSETIINSSGAAHVVSPDGEHIMFIRGDETEGRFGTHERGPAFLIPPTDRHDTQDD